MFKRLKHHAYCIEGAGREKVSAFAEKLREVCELERGYPDLVALAVPSFGIDDAHFVRALARQKPVAGGKKFFVLGADAVTREAQNALLKTFEEPTPATHFFLLVSSAELLAPTLRSRMEVAPIERFGVVVVKKHHEEARAFLAAPTSARLARAEKIAAALKDEKMERGEGAAFIEALQAEVRGEGAFPRERADALEKLLRTASYARDQSSSFKLLLEHLSLVLQKM